MSKKLKIALIGAGNIAQSAHMPVYEKREDVEITAIVDWNIERAKAAAEKFGIPHYFKEAEEAFELPGIDAADICVWNRSHAPVAIAAAKKGLHILCEKPMAWDVAASLEMEKAVRETGITFMMAMVNRYHNSARLLNEFVQEGKLGEIYYAKTANVRRRGTPLGWFTDTSKSGGGPVIDIGVHCIDRCWFLMGRPKPVRVSANTYNLIGDYQTKGVDRWVALDSDVTAFDTEDSANGIIHFENGASMLFEASWAINLPPQGYTYIAGSKGGASLDPLTIYGEDGGYLTDNQPTVQKNDPFEAEIDHFIDCLRTGKTPLSSLEDGLMVQKMLNGIYDSAKAGKEVTL